MPRGVTSSFPLCLQMKSLWAPCPLFLQACLLATMTHPRTATSLDTMTYLRYGILHHLHLGARTAEKSALHGTVPVYPARRGTGLAGYEQAHLMK